MAEKWNGQASQNGWAIEIVADLLGVWAAGPAYLDSFLHHLHRDSVNPFQIDRDHPPYAVRTPIVAEAGRRLGWSEVADQMEGVTAEWKRDQSHNWLRCHELCDRSIVESLISRLLEVFDQHGMPRCSNDSLAVARDHAHASASVEFGTQLVIDAYVAHCDLPIEEFRVWHAEVIDGLGAQVMR
ncbi:MAG: hypothetical protein DWQ34_24615 [Planctomycetota bacterium]|nr:MAG: hypothetical protein DWQ34_24615 [Planctomycetota bacterium]